MANAKKLRDYFWIWGHPTNCLRAGNFGFNRQSFVSPMEGLTYMGATNLILNDLGEPPFDMVVESEAAKDLPELAWVVHGGHDKVTELVELAKDYKNITKAFYDDFFSLTYPENNFTNYTPEMMAQIREELHAVGLEMWVVLYTENLRQVDMGIIRDFLKEFDGISLWFWKEEEILNDFHKHIADFFALSEGKKRLIGCYVWDFGAEKEATAKAVLTQLNNESKLIKDGLIDGVIIHTNSVFGTNPPLEAVDACQDWMREHGDEPVSQ